MTTFVYSYKDLERKYNFSDQELWDLYYTFSLYILRGLKQFRSMSAPPTALMIEMNPGICLMDMSTDYNDKESEISKASVEWDKIYDKILMAFQIIVDRGQDECFYSDNSDGPVIKEGLELFAKYFFDFWT